MLPVSNNWEPQGKIPFVAQAKTSRIWILIMWSFGNPKSSIAVIIIAILLFAEMNAITSLKLQSFNNNRARRNPLTADTKCCPDIVRRRTKRFIRLLLWRNNGFYFNTEISSIATASIVGAIAAGLGFGAGLIGAGIGSFWKTGTTSSQAVQPGSTSGYPIVSPAGAGIHYSNGGNGQYHYYYYFPPPYYYYYG